MSGAGGVAYELTGEGAPLLLIHGITESRRMWDPLVPRLAANHAVLAVDLPGHGESADAEAYDPLTLAEAVAGATADAGLGRPVVVGHSLGGVVATAYAALHPTAGVVNVDQPLELVGFQEALLQLEPILRGDEASFLTAMEALFTSLAGPLAGAERERIDALRRPRQDIVLAIWTPVLETLPGELDAMLRAFTERVHVPYLSLHGIDPGPAYAEWLADAIPTSTVEVWTELGHYPQLMDPERFLARLAAFESSLG